ncbi:MAG: hypothetical protein KGQ38_03180 [Actinomycetales bacterium]|nr:hypothetical protein [Actinomycetales bacterium]
MKSDPWSGHNPESDEVFQRKVIAYRLHERMQDLLQERLFEEIKKHQVSETYVTISTGDLSDSTIELCHICARGLAQTNTDAGYRACRNCLTFDAVLGAEFDGRMFLPLGRHLADNGAILDFDAQEIAQQAQSDAVAAIVAAWEALTAWRSAQVRELARNAGWQVGDSITLTQWQDTFPPSTEASLDAYLKLIETSHSWVFGLASHTRSRQWFIGGATGLTDRPDEQQDSA